MMKGAGARRSFAESLKAWFLENSMIWAIAYVRTEASRQMQPAADASLTQKLVQTYILILTGNLLTVETIIVTQHIYIEYVYAHIPFFEQSPKKVPLSATNTWIAISDWVGCNFVTHNLIAALLTGCILPVDQETIDNLLKPSEVNLLTMLGKLAIVRVSADISFYVIHRALHSPTLYKWIHSRHHQHFNTRLQTNFHFTVADLFLEAFLPILVGLAVLLALGVEVTLFEFSVISLYIGWYEIGSHSGKPVPTVTYFPPLAVVYNSLLPFDIDANNVQFHETHHNLLRCNYGITQWCDIAMGTST
jgi:sterol desaturase/sphingolipid hydroxylase (fatty acid hydroxylase superfamily)